MVSLWACPTIVGEGKGEEDLLYHGERFCSRTRNSRRTRPWIMSWNLDISVLLGWLWRQSKRQEVGGWVWTFLIDVGHQYDISSAQFSHVWLFETPWTAAHQASLSITNSRSPPKPMSIESVMPSNHLILCHPLLLLPPIPPSIRVFSNESALHQVAEVLESQHQSFQWSRKN